MNKERRKRIEKIRQQVSILQSEVDEILEEEQGYQDNLPEAFIDKYDRADEVIGYLDEASSQMREAVENLDSAAE